MTHPGPWLARREQAVAAGKVVYARWGRLAVFFTPCLISGIAKMKLSQFAAWNLLAGAVYVLSVGPAAYGAGSVASGHASVGATRGRRRDRWGPGLQLATRPAEVVSAACRLRLGQVGRPGCRTTSANQAAAP